MLQSVDPLPDKEFVKSYLAALNAKHPKYGILLLLGIETGLRISDILSLRVRNISSNMHVKEGKTQKWRTIVVSDTLQAAIKAYARAMGLHRTDYLVHRTRRQKNVPLSRVQAYRVLRSTAEDNGLMRIGTHTLRKTFANRLYAMSGDPRVVQRAMRHRFIDSTLHYLTKRTF